MDEVKFQQVICYSRSHSLLRTTAVPAGTAQRVLAMAILSVRLSVCHDPVPNQGKVR